MKKILLLISLSFSLNLLAQDKKQECKSLQKAYEEAQEEAYDVIPDDLHKTAQEVDLSKIEACKSEDNEFIIKTKEKIIPQHLVSAGVYLGYAIFGADLNYTRLDNKGRYRDHFSLMANGIPNLWKGVGLQYGKHIKGSIFFVGANTHYLNLYNGQNSIGAGPIVGLRWGKGAVSGHVHAGVMTVYESGFGFETMPQVGAGIRFRFFKK